MIFILVLNNGQSYEDFDKWNAGVFSTLKKAFEYGVENSFSGYFTVEEWAKGATKSLTDHYYEKNSIGEWK
jgi:hypothetical protein